MNYKKSVVRWATRKFTNIIGWKTIDRVAKSALASAVVFLFVASPLVPIVGFGPQVALAAGGNGTQGSPYIIETANEFATLVGNNEGNVGTYFRLGNDITLPGSYATITNFNGYLDGNSHEISGLNKALFGEMASVEIDLGEGMWETVGGVVENLVISGDVTTTSDSTGYGLLARRMDNGTVRNVSASGSLTITGGSCESIGGLIGDAFYSNIEGATVDVEVNASGCDKVGGLTGSSVNTPIMQAGSLGAVTGRDSSGGLVGYGVCGDNGSGIRESFATGDVSGDDYVGGLIGNADGSECSGIVLQNVYARGSVEGSNYVGGLAGSFYGEVLERSYSTGSVGGEITETTGGLVGEKSEWSSGVEHSFWDSRLAGVSRSDGGMDVVSEDLDMKDEYTYTSWFENGGEWDFESIWSINENENDGYPCLQWSDESCAFSFGGGSGWDGSDVAMHGYVYETGTTNPVPNADIELTCGEGSGVVIQANGSGAYTFTKAQIYDAIDSECPFAAGIGLYAAADGYNDGEEEWSEDVIGDETWEEWIDRNFTGQSQNFYLDGVPSGDYYFSNPSNKTVVVDGYVTVTDLSILGDGDENEILNVNLFVSDGMLEFGDDAGLTFEGSSYGNNLQFSGTRANINAALETLIYTATSDTGTVTVEALINGEGGGVLWAENGHAYKVVSPDGGITWANAKTAAEGQTFGGVNGYLATITSQDEHDFILTRIDQSGWIGATDNPALYGSASEGEWYWATGPEAGTHFWTGGQEGNEVGDEFAKWSDIGTQEPNNAGSNEHCAQIRFRLDTEPHILGLWNDSTCTTAIPNYVVEFGGIGGVLPTVVNTSFDITVTELGDWADLTTVNVTNIGKTSATIQGSGQLNNGLTIDDIDVGEGGILQVGFHFNTESTVDWDTNSHTAPVMNASIVGGDNTNIIFSGEVTGLECNTRYWYVAAYDYDEGGELGVANNVLNFKTASCGSSGGSGGSSSGSSGGSRTSAARLNQPTNSAAVQNLIVQNRDVFTMAHAAGINLPAYILEALGLGKAEASAPDAAGLCPRYAFTRDLRFGDEGEDVRALQKFLNCAGFALGSTGPGSAGQETIYFVERTREALIRFQEKYSQEVLVPINATSGTGIFSSYSRAKVQSLMKAE